MAQEIGLFDAEYNSALEDFNEGKTAVALAKLNNLLDLNPNHLDSYLFRAKIYSNEGLNEQALADYNFVLDRLPETLDDAYVERGLVHSAMKNFDLAIMDYTTAIEANKNHVLAYIQRAYCNFEESNYTRAIDDLTKALQLESTNFYALYMRGYIFEYHKEEDQLAINDINKLLQLDPTYFDAYMVRGHAYYNLYEDEKACSDFRTALDHGVENAEETISEFCTRNNR